MREQADESCFTDPEAPYEGGASRKAILDKDSAPRATETNYLPG